MAFKGDVEIASEVNNKPILVTAISPKRANPSSISCKKMSAFPCAVTS